MESNQSKKLVRIENSPNVVSLETTLSAGTRRTQDRLSCFGVVSTNGEGFFELFGEALMYSHSWSKSRKQQPLWLLVSNKNALFSRHQTTVNGVHTIGF